MKSSRSAWASLLRLPNVFTVLADVSAAFLLVSGPPAGGGWWIRWVLIVTAGVLLYWAGMILNDVFDIEKDRAERPHRPLPSGQICRRRATAVAVVFLFGGVVAAFQAGQFPAEGFAVTLLPLVIAAALTVAILLYDGPLKRTAVAAYLMGGCRTLSFLLGGSAAAASPMMIAEKGLTMDAFGVPPVVIVAAIGFGIYVTGLTLIGRKEAVAVMQLGGSRAATSANVNTGTVLTGIGLFVLAFSPRSGLGDIAAQVDPDGIFVLAIVMIGFPIFSRAIRAAMDPVPIKLQMTVKSGILTIIPLSACFAVLGAGYWGGAVFALIFPAFWMAIRYKVT